MSITDLNIGIEVVTKFAEPVLDSAEERVQRGEVCEPRSVHQGLQAFTQDTCQMLAKELALYRVD